MRTIAPAFGIIIRLGCNSGIDDNSNNNGCCRRCRRRRRRRRRRRVPDEHRN